LVSAQQTCQYYQAITTHYQIGVLITTAYRLTDLLHRLITGWTPGSKPGHSWQGYQDLLKHVQNIERRQI
jgi:hypothetical protein